MMTENGYWEAERGRFETNLLRGNVVIAYTSGDRVELAAEYKTSDKEAVEEFAAQYDLVVEW